jgi:hypothetical protein
MAQAQLVHRDFMRCFVAEAFSGSVIEAVRHEGDVLDGDVIEG